MAMVIRLQGLRIAAGSEDIRNFFNGLKIPDGGVHIIGGEKEEAFIIFASDEDARRAMVRSGGCIKGSPVKLLLSSKSEMQSLLEESTNIAELDQKRSPKEGSRRLHPDVPVGPRRTGRPNAVRSLGGRSRIVAFSNDDFYLFLKGMPFSVTEDCVRQFFDGLLVDGIILLKNGRGQNNGMGVVRFGTIQDARDGLMRDRGYMGSRFVEVNLSTEEQWNMGSGDVQGGCNTNGQFARGKSPVDLARHSQRRPRSRSPLANAPNSASSEELCLLLENLAYSTVKRNIKKLFHLTRLQDDQILYLLDSEGRRTRSAFVLFKSLSDYCVALTHHKEEFLNRHVYISPISREKMLSILESGNDKDGPAEEPERFHGSPLGRQEDPFDSEKVCLYVQNMPFDVRKVEIMDFFFGFNITKDSVLLLCDHKGAGIGEALVVFRSEGEAMNAQSLNGQRFLGSQVVLKCISRSEMQEFSIEQPALQEPMPREERYSARSSRDGPYHPDDMDYPNMRDPSATGMPMANLQVKIHGGSGSDSLGHFSQEGGNGSSHTNMALAGRNFDGPTCIRLVNLPSQIKIDEVYDFCYGYRIIPGSVSLQYNKSGMPKGSATVVFESRQEALTAVHELDGRPIGNKNIQLVFV
ncbi:hypothetical protein NHX12_001261 [Muraenolepis orangiensis]|uniref:RRM domain-containing protein n=1 Tax=Muraenolepis orangiensis TaxID=630683 RepID=A0A9Q0IGG2_9TELE|nr:hypothetical protein NHX12_001261 [Muraenolepis orangiensis]